MPPTAQLNELLQEVQPWLSARDVLRIRRHAAAADQAGWLHPAQQALIHQRGWLRMLAPQASGGAELPLPSVVRLEEALAAADGSVGWVVTLCAGAGWFAGFLQPELAASITGTRRVCLAGSGAPTGHADLENGGYIISGAWDYASGAPMASHFTLNAILRENGQPLLDEHGAPRIRAFVLPAAAVELAPSWQTMGLRATASHSYRVHERWVDASHGFDLTPQGARAAGPLYRYPFRALAFATLAANVSGMALHFLSLSGDIIAARRLSPLSRGVAGRPEVAAYLEREQSAFLAARSAFYGRLDAAWPSPDQARAAALEQTALALVQAARQAVDGVYPYCGLQAANPATAINRVWRDLHTATQHSLLLPI
ncbi:acyl-CoA dehydrogenase [Oxalobacteraceae bacterium A2-2]